MSYTTGRYLDCQSKALAAVGTSYVAAVTSNTNYEGTYYLRTNGYYCYSATAGGNIDRGSSAGTQQGYAWVVEDVTSLPVVVSELGLATLYSPTGLTVPEGVKAYSATKNEAISSVLFDEVEAVKAGTGVLVEGTAGTYEFPVAANEADYASDLVGSVATVAVSSIAANAYTLQSGPAFKLYTGDNLTGFRAHIETEASADIKAFDVIFDDATGISEYPGHSEDSDIIYNLAGQRIGKLQRGVNIINGKKILK